MRVRHAEGVRELGLRVRTGLHYGEVETRRAGDLGWRSMSSPA